MAQIDPASAESPRPETIEGLFQALESSLLGYALRLLEDRALAEDVVQETFMKLQGQWDQVRERRPWLYRTVHNLALNQRRRDRKIVPLDPSDAAEGSPAPLELTDPQLRPDEQLARHEAVGLVRLTLETLEPRSRELVKLKFNDELSYQEISARTGLKVGHVGYLLHHALKAVAAELAKAGLVP